MLTSMFPKTGTIPGAVVQSVIRASPLLKQFIRWTRKDTFFLMALGPNKNLTRRHCDHAMAPEQQPGIIVQKSVSMVGLKSTPYIACSGGFLFAKSTSQAPRIVLSGINFQQTPLSFQDCNLKIFNCSFQDASSALRIHIRNSPSIHLNIRGSSFFKNNPSCVEIILHNDARDQDQLLVINISKTKFLENGLPVNKQRFASGIVTIQSQTMQTSRIHVQISCFNITSFRNYGYFINLDLPSAVTSEVYHDVKLFNNTISGMVN